MEKLSVVGFRLVLLPGSYDRVKAQPTDGGDFDVGRNMIFQCGARRQRC
jgi:hypothetical protein